MSKKIENETIQLSLPINAAYASAARLTASSIAFRMGFDIDDVEDIKAAVSEACAFIIKGSAPDVHDEFRITFNLDKDFLDIHFTLNNSIKTSSSENEMILVMIEALVDKLTISPSKEEITVIDMQKTLRKSFI